jgi:hypothetical protein
MDIPRAMSGALEVHISAMHAIISTDEWWSLSPDEVRHIAMATTNGRADIKKVDEDFLTLLSDRGLKP